MSTSTRLDSRFAVGQRALQLQRLLSQPHIDPDLKDLPQPLRDAARDAYIYGGIEGKRFALSAALGAVHHILAAPASLAPTTLERVQERAGRLGLSVSRTDVRDGEYAVYRGATLLGFVLGLNETEAYVRRVEAAASQCSVEHVPAARPCES